MCSFSHALVRTLFSVGTTSWNAVRYRRHISFRTILPLLAAAFAGLRFFALYWAAKSGNYGIVGAAWLIAIGAEGFSAGEPAAVNMPHFCYQAKNEYIVMAAGFFLLFNLIYLPLATLIAAGASALLVMVLMNMFLRSDGRIDSNDMTMTGYLSELAVLFFYAILIG